MAYCALHKGAFADDVGCPFCFAANDASADFDDDSDIDDDESELDQFDCAMDRNGNCGKAGSEECEFECPYNRLIGIKN
jgi:hypothetical protein